MGKRGRPKGSKNKPTAEDVAVPASPAIVDIKEAKRQIRLLRKIKKDTHKGTTERRELNAKIRTIKNRILPYNAEITPEKKKLIDAINAYNKIYHPYLIDIGIDLNKFTMEQLQSHITKTQGNHTTI